MFKKIRWRPPKNKWRSTWFVWLILAMMASTLCLPMMKSAWAESCPDVRIIFARGSGGERWVDKNYQTFKSAIEEKLPEEISYDFVDLDYPAVGIGLENILVAIGAAISAGDAYEFGASVDAGVSELINVVNYGSCVDTQYVLGGYSQGAMVVSKALSSLNADKIIYAATFGDPKIYLPEGAGILPAACSGKNLSNYRMYVPDCRAYKGLLGSYRPYQPEAYIDKLGTWCNKYDIFCSSHFSISSHTSYVTDDLYEDASRVIVGKIASAFGVKNAYTSLHDTAILIDSTGSMVGMIEKYKTEALRLATETLTSGGRVALYDYRDLKDGYRPVARCDFETCNLDNFEQKLDEITLDGGGDGDESLLSASFTVMKELKWRRGATKSLVILTDAGYLSPDRDGMTYREVVKLSKTIDPVNFYIITTKAKAADYSALARDTGGKVFTNFSPATSYIMERYDSLPRVDECMESGIETFVRINSVQQTGPTEVVVRFEASGGKVLVILNDAVLGVVEGESLTLTNLKVGVLSTLTLVPLSDNRRSDGVSAEIVLDGEGYGSVDEDKNKDDDKTPIAEEESEVLIPKTPNTGRR